MTGNGSTLADVGYEGAAKNPEDALRFCRQAAVQAMTNYHPMRWPAYTLRASAQHLAPASQSFSRDELGSGTVKEARFPVRTQRHYWTILSIA